MGKNKTASLIDHSCPSIDRIIDDVEKVRAINSELREYAEYLESEVSDLEHEIEVLKKQIEDMDKR